MTAMSEYTPTEARICIDFCNAATKRVQPDGSFMSMEEADAAFSRWLAAHDAEVRAGVVAEEPEWEYRIAVEGEHEWPFGTRDQEQGETLEEVQAALGGQYGAPMSGDIERRTKAIAAGPWVPVKQEGASPSGFPVAGLLHAGGDSYTERKDADQPETDAEPVPEGLIHPPGDDEHDQEQGADEQVPVELHTDDSTPAGRHASMKQEGAET